MHSVASLPRDPAPLSLSPPPPSHPPPRSTETFTATPCPRDSPPRPSRKDGEDPGAASFGAGGGRRGEAPGGRGGAALFFLAEAGRVGAADPARWGLAGGCREMRG